MFAFDMFAFLSDVEMFHGAMIAHDAGPNFAMIADALFLALGAELVFAVQVSVFGANGKGRGDGNVWHPETFENIFHQVVRRS